MSGDSTALTGTAVNEVAQLAQDAAKVQTLTIGGYEFTDIELERVDVDPKTPAALQFYTLGGLVAYLLAEDQSPQKPFVHVESPTRVSVVSPLIGIDKHIRRIPAVATCHTSVLKGFAFNQHMPIEQLNVALQTCFEPERGDIDAIRHFCASVRATSEISTADDGVSQAIQAKRGIAAIQTTPVRPIWELAPWRTFPEIAQPTSPFILRFKESDSEPLAGLFETGNEKWRIEAVSAIAELLREKLGADWKVLG